VILIANGIKVLKTAAGQIMECSVQSSQVMTMGTVWLYWLHKALGD